MIRGMWETRNVLLISGKWYDAGHVILCRAAMLRIREHTYSHVAMQKFYRFSYGSLGFTKDIAGYTVNSIISALEKKHKILIQFFSWTNEMFLIHLTTECQHLINHKGDQFVTS